MKWTKEPPNQDGYYWLLIDNIAYIVSVADTKCAPSVYFVGNDQPRKPKELDGYWYGPLEPPV